MMLNIYRKYEVEKIIPQYEAESFCRMYRVYKKRGGNSFIDELYNHVTEWELKI